jgi:hypothetical protein
LHYLVEPRYSQPQKPWTILAGATGRHGRGQKSSGQFLGIHHPEIEALEKELADTSVSITFWRWEAAQRLHAAVAAPASSRVTGDRSGIDLLASSRSCTVCIPVLPSIRAFVSTGCGREITNARDHGGGSAGCRPTMMPEKIATNITLIIDWRMPWHLPGKKMVGADVAGTSDARQQLATCESGISSQTV